MKLKKRCYPQENQQDRKMSAKHFYCQYCYAKDLVFCHYMLLTGSTTSILSLMINTINTMIEFFKRFLKQHTDFLLELSDILLLIYNLYQTRNPPILCIHCVFFILMESPPKKNYVNFTVINSFLNAMQIWKRKYK